MRKRKKALLINPYIHDFKLYDEWMKPLGLYYVADYLCKNNVEIKYINCMMREHSSLKNTKLQRKKKYGTGNFYHTEIEKPIIYNSFPRKYKRYGIPIEIFRKDIKNIGDIDFIMITSYMTYWYRGLFETINIVREFYPNKPIFLGGIYPTLCYEHAKKYFNSFNPIDIIPGLFNENHLQKILFKIGSNTEIKNNENPFPKYDIEPIHKYIPLLTSFGCPYNCSYCANKYLNSSYTNNNAKMLINTIEKYFSEGIVDFAFYDDALLYRFNDNLYHILKYILMQNIKCNFHTPNAIHAKYITKNVAEMLYQSGFKTIRIGFETANIKLQKEIGNKATKLDIVNSINNLKKAGFKKENIGIYIMIGLKRQTLKEIMDSIDFIASQDVLVKPVTYSPIPHTKEYYNYLKDYPEIENEPLYQNDAFFIIHSNFIIIEQLNQIKSYVKKLNE